MGLPFLRVLVFLAVSGSLLLAIHLFLYRRWVKDVTDRVRLHRFGAGTLVSLAFAALVARPVFYLTGNEATRPFALAVLGWMGFALGGFMLLAGIEGVRIVHGVLVALRRVRPVSEERRLFLSRAVASTSVVVSGVASGYGAWRALGPPETTEVPIALPRLPKALSGLTLVQLSDLHIGEVSQEKFMADLVQRCNALRPDAVVITGDLVDGSVPRLGPFLAPLQRMQARYGTFFITGNHDYYSGADAWCDALERLGVQVLRNRRVSLGDAGASIDLAGVDDWGARHSGRGYDLRAALHGRDPERAMVLLAHQPANFEEAVRRGVGLQLSGHTHGGQIFPLTSLVNVAWPYAAGKYERHGSSIYVSRGCGFVGPPMRVGSPPEIVKVVLTDQLPT